MSSIVVVEADLDAPHHQAAVVEMIDAYARDPMGQGAPLPEAVRRELIPGLRRHSTTLVFLAFDGARPVGVAVCFVGFSTFAARPVINIHDLAVAYDYRHQGVGRMLLEQVEAKGRAMGCAKLTLEVNAENLPARRLYTGLGFGDGKSEGALGRVWFLQKRL